MKNLKLLICLPIIVLAACSPNTSVVSIAPRQTLALDYPDYQFYEVEMKNRSGKEIEVQVLRKGTEETISGFGLSERGNATLAVEEGGILTLRNTAFTPGKISLQFTEKTQAFSQSRSNSISFTLRNNTAKSIPLIIPNVMNPNLSPFSNSGVDLEIGQEILFRQNGKRHILLVVDEKITPGSKLDVAKILDERKKELGL